MFVVVFGAKHLLNYPELIRRRPEHKLDSIETSGVNTLVTNCTACVLQLEVDLTSETVRLGDAYCRTTGKGQKRRIKVD